MKGLARECEFNCECGRSYAESLIRDMVVVHTPEDKVRYEALQKSNPTLEEVRNLASVYEVTASTAQQMEAGRTVMQVRENAGQAQRAEAKGSAAVRKDEVNHKLKSCRGCFIAHDRKECRFLKARCFKCDKVGHIQSVCAARAKNSSRREKQKRWIVMRCVKLTRF